MVCDLGRARNGDIREKTEDESGTSSTKMRITLHIFWRNRAWRQKHVTVNIEKIARGLKKKGLPELFGRLVERCGSSRMDGEISECLLDCQPKGLVHTCPGSL